MSRKPPRPQLRKFGEKLKALRLSKGLTLQEFAKAVGYHAHGYISELEAGKKTPTVEFVLAVSRYYGVSTDELIRDEIELSTNTPKF